MLFSCCVSYFWRHSVLICDYIQKSCLTGLYIHNHILQDRSAKRRRFESSDGTAGKVFESVRVGTRRIATFFLSCHFQAFLLKHAHVLLLKLVIITKTQVTTTLRARIAKMEMTKSPAQKFLISISYRQRWCFGNPEKKMLHQWRHLRVVWIQNQSKKNQTLAISLKPHPLLK